MAKKILIAVSIALSPYLVLFLFLYGWQLFSPTDAEAESWSWMVIFVPLVFAPLWYGAGIIFHRFLHLSFAKSLFIANGLGILSLVVGIIYYDILGFYFSSPQEYASNIYLFMIDFISNSYWQTICPVAGMHGGAIVGMCIFIGYISSKKEFFKEEANN